MKAPEKIYLDIRGFEKVELLFSEIRQRFGVPYYEHPISNNDIEYTRTDAFIERAATWIANRYQSNGSYLNAGDIEDFRKAMKG